MSRRVARRRTHKKNPAAYASSVSQSTGAAVPGPSLETFKFIPVESLPKSRRKPGTERLPKALRQPVVLSAGPGAAFAQRPNIPQSIIPGSSALATFLADEGTTPGDVELDDELFDFMTADDFDPARDVVSLGTDVKRRHSVRRAAQHATWRDTVIPSLVKPFLDFIHGRAAPPRTTIDCPCSSRRTVSLLMADWEDTRHQCFTVCRCAPVAPQLVEQGYFPCAPKRPSMAFSLRLLEFISLHSLNVAPNHTAWSTTLEAFWARRGFVVHDQESRGFRKRLANAVHWYQVLVNQKDAAVTSAINSARSSLARKRSSEEGEDGSHATKRRRTEPAAAHGAPTDSLRDLDNEGEASTADSNSGAGAHGGRDHDDEQHSAAHRAPRAAQTSLESDFDRGEHCLADVGDARDAGVCVNIRAGTNARQPQPAGVVRGVLGDGDVQRGRDDEVEGSSAGPRRTQPARAARGMQGDSNVQRGVQGDGDVQRGVQGNSDVQRGVQGDSDVQRGRDDEVEGSSAGPRRTQPARAARGMQGDEGVHGVDTEDPPSADAHAARRAQEDTQQQRLSRPSEYLRARCPLCFGGPKPVFKQTSAHAIVCLDANFAQKRRKAKYSDPPLNFAGGRFVPPEEVDDMEQEVEAKRKRPSKRRKKSTAPSLDDEVLDECEQSFLAAQEKVTKASKNYYADTGLMALLCRHDRVLYVANMTTPGERQHYALSLLRKLFEDLPSDWNIGVLYDIACQLSRSISKHDLLEDYADRLVFGVSVFHAYGHQWACQLVFHPRKRDGFGLTDGEGCERFWSSIRHLIACLRVSGFFRRLFVLDRQMEHIDAQGLSKTARWLSKRWSDTSQRLLDAERKLSLCGVAQTVLRAQWREQIAAQVAPVPRQSKNAGDKQIDKILLDLALVDELSGQSKHDRATLKRSAHRLDAHEVQQIVNRIEAAKRDVQAARARIATAQSQLGTGSLRKFEQLRGDAYVRSRVNARALRVRIRMAVQAHKFEREKLERNYRRQIMENKDHAQTRDLVHSREKGITALVRKYNILVDHIGILLRDGPRSRRRLAVPRKLDAKKLFRLDIDDDIWQADPGLGPQDEGDLPRWQVDEDVRAGIRHMLEADRCREERERLQHEASALRAWWQEEYKVLVHCQASTQDDPIRHEVSVRLRHLEHLAVVWTQALAATGIATTFGPNGGVGAAHAAAVGAAADRGSSLVTAAAAAAVTVIAEGARASARSAAAQNSAPEPGSPDGSDGWTSEGSFYMSGDDVTDAGEDEVDALLLDMAMDDAGAADTDDDAACPDPALAPGPVRDASDAIEASLPIQASSPTRQTTVIEISSDSSDDEGNALPVKRASARPTEKARSAGHLYCIAEDVARMASRTAWLSGAGLAVFAQAKLIESGTTTIGHCPSTLLVDVQDYLQAKEVGNTEKMEQARRYVWKAVERLPPPAVAEAWLIVVHITLPEHWTLVEVCWPRREIRFYDSLSEEETYDQRVRDQTLGFLSICEEQYNVDLDLSSWRWVGEKRAVRQTNWYDCGPFVAADFVSLVTSGRPSPLRQADMREWRETMTDYMRKLPVYPARASRTLTAEQVASAHDVDQN